MDQAHLHDPGIEIIVKFFLIPQVFSMVNNVITGIIFEMYTSFTYIIASNNDSDLDFGIFPDNFGNVVIGMTIRVRLEFSLFTKVPDDIEEMMNS